MLLSSFIDEATRALLGLYPREESRSIVLWLTQDLLGTGRHTHITEPEYRIPPALEEPLQQALSRLAKGEPIQYVLGYAEFCGLRFAVRPGVLIPRPETEDIVRRAVTLKPARVLDLCTGSGCIAWSISLLAGCRDVVGVDISPVALSVASSQATSLGDALPRDFAPPVFIQADVLGAPPSGLGNFGLIVSNPPYILESEKPLMRPNVLEHEPALALFVPSDDPLLFYRAIARWSRLLLADSGHGITEINENFGREVAAVFAAEGFVNVGIEEDFFGKKRFITYQKRPSTAL